MTLRERQSLFARLVPRLIDWAYANGYEITFGEAWRSAEEAARNALRGTGTRDSLHCDRLAIDLNLFRDGKWLSDSAAHKPLADYWKSLHPDCRWGGDFKRPDGNHYSVTDGRRA
jgi:hypothetical protein